MNRSLIAAAALAVAGCSGSKGDPGASGQSVQSASLSPGSTACPYGGSQFASASGTTYACNGAPGATGAQGIQGPQGLPGPSGLARTFYTTEQVNIAAVPSGAYFFARTPTYVAGTGERALLFAQGACILGTNQTLVVRGGYALDGGPDTAIGSPAGITSTSVASSATLATSGIGALDLTPGSSYTFSAAVNDPWAGTGLTCTASLVVMVVRQ
jgi:hypothetical protein